MLDSTGKGGNLTIETRRLTVTEGSQISASTFGQGNAGNLTIHAKDSIELSGGNSLGRSGLFAVALEENGNGGELKVFTQDLIIRDGATISASNFQSLGLRTPGTGEAGSLAIEAKNITLENDARINAATQAGDNGNITLKVAEDIILRNNSLISAQAFKDATGGNLDIDARFIIAFPNQNNDIIANAAQGNGGKIDIIAEALFGIEERPLDSRTNDINASSDNGFPGEINIQQPTIDPVSGLLELTQEVVDPAELIAQNVCTQTADSEFVDIGKGGLPQNPKDILAENAIEVELVTPITVSAEEIKSNREIVTVKSSTNRKPPAQGWIFHENGIVELVAYNPHQVGEQRTWENYQGCR
ncbi:MAG: S-layer family protein [Xenococcaceae cyanobacterium MO_188.B29]|nr:S-layer family protein [Xenococcaceae cyanobacterium MO_188.B29]